MPLKHLIPRPIRNLYTALFPPPTPPFTITPFPLGPRNLRHHLEDLPAELQTTIFHLTFTPPALYRITTTAMAPGPPRRFRAHPAPFPSTMHVSRHTRALVLARLHSDAVIFVCHDSRIMGAWLRVVEPDLCARAHRAVTCPATWFVHLKRLVVGRRCLMQATDGLVWDAPGVSLKTPFVGAWWHLYVNEFHEGLYLCCAVFSLGWKDEESDGDEEDEEDATVVES